ncbi:MAG: hypothetical protein PWR01_2911 [Clostridiales bacterium]|nr:hypothetical protein [Clostridiales bacterium]MDN5281838.1 hypothetical protein [Candidatus Ozemobacter sp.]
MNEINQSNSDPKREFDWGPPGNSVFDSIKEYLVYLIIVLLLAAGAWFLMDINARKVSEAKDIIVTQPAQKTEKNFEPQVKTTTQQEPQIKFLVQLGAFADKKSATDAFEALKEHGFSPELSEPDSQFEIYRVSLGPYMSEPEAEMVAEKLNSLDFHSFVIEFR